MSNNFINFLIWITFSAIGLTLCFQWIPNSYTDGVFLPVGHDSYYHAKRIIDSYTNLSLFYEFDPNIHVPEGSWITWPWFYDYFLALIVGQAVQWFSGSTADKVLVFIPAYWGIFDLLLLLGITQSLRLSWLYRVLVMVCYVASPLFQILHGVGRIDHHFMEQSLVFLVLLTGLRYFQHPDRPGRALIFGVVIGFAPAVHNGLFILQIPLLATLGIFWVKKRTAELENTGLLAAGLISACLLILLPSGPFQQGFFEYYTLSWFHLYSAFCSAILIVFFNYFHTGLKQWLLLMAVISLMVVVGIKQLLTGLDFISADFFQLSSMTESASPLDLYHRYGLKVVSGLYSALILLAPLIIMALLVKLFGKIDRQEIYLFVYCLVGLVLMLTQFRFHQYGSFALYLPLIYVVDKWISQHTVRRRSAALISGLFACLLLASQIPTAFLDRLSLVPTSEEKAYLPLYRSISEICHDQPGAVLADMNVGHFISYHSRCQVIANNFIQTPLHMEKLRLVEELLNSDLATIRQRAPWIRYLFVRPFASDIVRGSFREGSLAGHLLTSEVEPPGLRLLAESRIQVEVGGHLVSAARFYRVSESD